MNNWQPAPSVWDYAQLAYRAEQVEYIIDSLTSIRFLRPYYKNARVADDPHVRRAWADVAPAAARRKFGDCKQVNALQALAAADLAKLIEPEELKPRKNKPPKTPN